MSTDVTLELERLNKKYFDKSAFNGIKIGAEKENKVNPLLTCIAKIFDVVNAVGFDESENNTKLKLWLSANANSEFPLTFRNDLEDIITALAEANGYSPLRYEQVKALISFIKIENRAMFNLAGVSLEEFRELRVFLRVGIKTTEKIRVHNDPESLLIQEIKKFDDFYSFIIYKDDKPYIDSKFREYLISFVSEDDAKLIRSLVNKFKKGIRVKIGVKETKKGKVVFLTTAKQEVVELIVHNYNKKPIVEKN